MSSSKSSSQLSVCSSGVRRGAIGTGATGLNETAVIVIWGGIARLSFRTKCGGEGGGGVGVSARDGILFFVEVDRGGAMD